MDDPYDLNRFVEAQDAVYDRVRGELAAGCKRSHWIWFIFPQIAGLGFSPMARRYAISGLKEAEAYLRHPILGPRLESCTRLVNAVEGRSINQILGHPDDLKFRSSMTLFAHAGPEVSVFRDALETHFGGEEDRETVSRL